MAIADKLRNLTGEVFVYKKMLHSEGVVAITPVFSYCGIYDREFYKAQISELNGASLTLKLQEPDSELCVPYERVMYLSAYLPMEG